jgi:hypothetical protein
VTPTHAEVEAFRIAFELYAYPGATVYHTNSDDAGRLRTGILAGYAAVEKLRAEKVEPHRGILPPKDNDAPWISNADPKEGTHASAEYAALRGQIAALRANVEMLLKRAVLKPAKKGAKKQ